MFPNMAFLVQQNKLRKNKQNEKNANKRQCYFHTTKIQQFAQLLLIFAKFFLFFFAFLLFFIFDKKTLPRICYPW